MHPSGVRMMLYENNGVSCAISRGDIACLPHPGAAPFGRFGISLRDILQPTSLSDAILAPLPYGRFGISLRDILQPTSLSDAILAPRSRSLWNIPTGYKTLIYCQCHHLKATAFAASGLHQSWNINSTGNFS